MKRKMQSVLPCLFLLILFWNGTVYCENLHIVLYGHSYLFGESDMEGLLPRMLQHGKGHSVKISKTGPQANHVYMGIMADTLVKEDAWTVSHRTPEQAKEMSTNALNKIEDVLDEGVDYLLFLNGTGGSHTLNSGYGYRIFADTIRALDPDVNIIPFAQYAGARTYQEFAEKQNTVTAAYNVVISEPNFDILPMHENDNSKEYHAAEIFKAVADGIGPLSGNVFVAPAGEAWRTVYREGQDMTQLYRDLDNGDWHADFWGNYINVCVVYSVITGEKFDGTGFSSTLNFPNQNPIPDDKARYFEEVAWKAYKEQKKFADALASGHNGPWVPPSDTGATVLKTNCYRKIDTAGRLLESGKYNSSGELNSRKTYEYDSNDRVKKETVWNDNGTKASETNYEYIIDNGKVSEIRYADGNGTYKGSYKYTYDSQGKLIEEGFYAPDNSFDAFYRYTYNAQDLVAERHFFNANGELQGVEKRKYDTQSRLDTTIETDVSSSCTLTTSYEYGNPVTGKNVVSTKRMVSSCTPTKVTQIEYTYNDKADTTKQETHQVTEENGSNDTTLFGVITYTYDYVTSHSDQSHVQRTDNKTLIKVFTPLGKYPQIQLHMEKRNNVQLEMYTLQGVLVKECSLGVLEKGNHYIDAVLPGVKLIPGYYILRMYIGNTFQESTFLKSK